MRSASANLVEIGRNEEDRGTRLLQRQEPPMNEVARRDRPRVPEVPRATLAASAELPEGVVISEPLRQAYFGPVHGWRDTRVVNRGDLVDRSKGLVLSRNMIGPASSRPARNRALIALALSLSMCR
jgi:hypothetical protein